MRNLNLIFNKLYYKELKTSNFKKSLQDYNKEIFDCTFNPRTDYTESQVPCSTFVLKTTYPGLLVGTGNPHGSNQQIDADINMGFSFDYVTGQPYISGSSVKGILRSCFAEKSEAVTAIIKNEKIDVKALEKNIFDGNDIFFDAVI